MGDTTRGATVREQLLPYVPRLVVDWLRNDPDARYRRVDGSLVFVDISGFTKLAERLARKGKVGAEELSDTLDSTFTELLSVAYDYGAGVVKWGGDAVLLLFDGAAHAERACRGAVEMQRTLRRVGRIQTESGTVVLRMSVGVNTGAFDFFLVGESHRELLIAGRAATETTLLEAAADAGEIVVAPATAATLPPRHVGEPKGPGYLLRGVPPAPSSRSALPGDYQDLSIEECLPVAIRTHLLSTDREPEHRNIAVAFVEFRGTDVLIEERGGEEVAAALHECISAVQNAVDRHNVTFHETDISKDGGKILLLAGAPRSAGDDEERLLRTVRAIMDSQLALPLRVGINCGPVFSGDFGPPYRRTFSIKGDAVNLAARLMGKAETGQIVASDEVVRRSRTVFALDELEPFFVKGKAAAIHAHGLGAVRGRSGPASGSPLVGRRRELDALLAGLASARDWHGRYVEVAAGPGMGKSRLIEELRARAGDVTVLSGACTEYESATPYYAVRALLRTVLGLDDLDGSAATERLVELVAELAPRLLPWLPLIALPLQLDVPPTPEVEGLDDEFRKERLNEVVQELLGLGLLAPTLFLFEDVHWMDDASRDLLRALVDHLEDRPWLIVTTTRSTELGLRKEGAAVASLIQLDPLDEADALQMLEEVTAEVPLPPHQLELLRDRAEGNPLYLQELVGMAQRLGGVDELPDSVGGVIAAQIDRLPAADRTALRRAAVLGTSFDRGLLRTVVPEMSPIEFCNRLGEFLETGAGRIRFRHALVRDTAYEGLAYSRRRALHGAVGDALVSASDGDADDQAALLSLHFYEAQRYAEAWRYSCVAGRAAKTLYANVDAARFFERAVAAARRVDDVAIPELAATYEALGDVRLRLSDYEGGEAALGAARRLVQEDPAETARLLLREGAFRYRTGRYTQALRWFRRGLRTLEGMMDPAARRQRARLYVWLGVVRYHQARASEAIDWCRRAIDEATAVDAREALAHAYYMLDVALWAVGRTDEAVYSERSLAIYEELGDLNEQAGVVNNLGMYAYYENRWDEAIELYERAEQLWTRSGDRWKAAFAATNRAELLSDQGRLEEAEPLFRGALRIARSVGSPAHVAEIGRFYGRLLARAGRFDEAHALLEEARAEFASAGLRGDVLLMDARIAECFALEGRVDESFQRCDAALELLPKLEGVFMLLPYLLRIRGWALVALGSIDEGMDVLTRSMDEARAKDATYEVALAADALAQGQRLAGRDASDLEALRDEICSLLGVVSPPVLPLPQLDVAVRGLSLT